MAHNFYVFLEISPSLFAKDLPASRGPVDDGSFDRIDGERFYTTRMILQITGKLFIVVFMVLPVGGRIGAALARKIGVPQSASVVTGLFYIMGVSSFGLAFVALTLLGMTVSAAIGGVVFMFDFANSVILPNIRYVHCAVTGHSYRFGHVASRERNIVASIAIGLSDTVDGLMGSLMR